MPEGSRALRGAFRRSHLPLSSCLELCLWLPEREASVASGPLSPARPASAHSPPSHSRREAAVCSGAPRFDSEETPSQSGWRGGSGCGRDCWGFAVLHHLVSPHGRHRQAWSSPRAPPRVCLFVSEDSSFRPCFLSQAAPPEDMASFSHCEPKFHFSSCGYRGQKLVSEKLT